MTDYEVSAFMKILLKSQFPQFTLLRSDNFCEEAKKRGIRITERDLEYFDKKEIIRPCLRFSRPIIENEFADVSLGSPFAWKYFFKQKHIEIPKKGDFKPWYKHRTLKNNNKIWVYYHSWQLLFLKDQIRGSISKIKTSALFSKKFDFQEYVKREKRTYTRYLEIMENRSKTYFNQIIGLLMMLDEPYSVDVRHIFHPNPDDDNSILKWDQWKKNKKYSKSIHRKSGLLIKDLEVIYRRLAFDANNLDPINKWNPFMSTIRRSKKRDLRGDALIAQDYFDALEMMALHIKEISGKTMLHVSDSNPWLNNGWKEMKYGKPYDIKSEKTKKQILSDFLKSRPVTTSIIVEGKTEEKVTRKIMKQVYVENPEKQGIHIYNIRGSGNLTQRNIDGYITRANLEENEIYIILDQDAKKYIKKHAGKTIKKENTTVWEKDFEEDNFGISIVIKKANSLLKKYNKESITEEEVIQACKK